MKTLLKLPLKLFILLQLLDLAVMRDLNDLKCLRINKFQSITQSNKTISQITDCTKISKDCCYINITYKYIDHYIESQYCASISGNITNMKLHLENLLNNDLMNYATSHYNNRAIYSTIARHYNEPFYKYSSWADPAKPTDYSTYLQDNCGKFNSKGDCLLEKNVSYFERFVEKFYTKFTSEFCNKKEDGTKCVSYKGSTANNALIRPLLKDLATYLHVDNISFQYENTDSVVEVKEETNDDDSSSDTSSDELEDIVEQAEQLGASSKWTNTLQTPKVNKTKIVVQINCSEEHETSSYLKTWCKYLLLLGFMFILF